MTGRPLASFARSALAPQIEFVTADTRYSYLSQTPVGNDAHASLLIREPINPRCG